MFSMFPKQQRKFPRKSMGWGTNGWSHGSNGWYWPTHPWISFLFFLRHFSHLQTEAKKNPMVSCSTKQYDSNPTHFRADFLDKQLIYIIQNRISKKNAFCGFCVSKTLPIFCPPPPVSSTKTEDQIEVCESSSQLIRAGLIQCHGDTLTTLPSCNDFRVFQGCLLGHRADKKDKTKGTWKQSHCFKMNLRTLSIILYIYISDSIFVETHQ